LKAIENAQKKTYSSPSVYINLGDLYYEMGKKQESLKHYQTAFSLYRNGTKIEPDDLGWVIYRLSILSPVEVYSDIFKDIQGVSPINRFSKLLWKEASVKDRMERIF
jgi:tetratricopeptide (TPR) repeat protein